MNQDPYSYDGEHVLRNRYDIHDKEKLTMLEDFLFELNYITIMKNDEITVPGFTKDTFLALHRFLCGDLYDWAGCLRTSDIGILYDHVAYESPDTMPRKLDEVFSFIHERENFFFEDDGNAIKNLALVFSSLKVLQPFRDMNTRTSMLFTVLLGAASERYIDFSELEEERLSMTSISYRDGNPDPAVLEFAGHTYGDKGELIVPDVIMA